MREIELKFELSQEDAARLARARLFGNTKPVARRMHAVYYDTPDHRLARNGMALRVRDEGGRWVQCLKAGHSGEAGLHARDEWEVLRPDASLDLAALRGTPLAAAMCGSRARLAPVFEVQMKRLSWNVAVGRTARVEVALDRGEVRRARKRASVCEVEIESLEGDPLAVFRIADRLAGSVVLHASAVTKAQRGYELSRPRRAKPAKASSVLLDEGASVDGAARSVVSAALAQMQANASLAAAAGADDEWLHQYRVGLRRLRSALRIFRDAFAARDAERMRSDCRWLSRITGEARDWDVFTGQILPGLLQGATATQSRAVLEAARRGRDAAHGKVRTAVESPRYTRFTLNFARWLAGSHGASKGNLRKAASRALQSQHRKSTRGLRQVASMRPRARHRVRIRLKRLRYACEGLACLFGHDRDHPYVVALAQLQSDLGAATDAQVALRLVKSLPFSAGRRRKAMASLQAMEAESLRDIAAHAQALRAARPFWRREND